MVGISNILNLVLWGGDRGTERIYACESIRVLYPPNFINEDKYRFFVGPIDREWFKYCMRIMRINNNIRMKTEQEYLKYKRCSNA